MMDIAVFNQFDQAKILVVGDIMLDRYLVGDSQRISPEAPVPVVKINNQNDKLGGAANVARNIRYLDASVGLLGIIGDDENGERIKTQLHEENINAHLIKSNKPTITKLRVISRKQQVVRLDFETPFDQGDTQALPDALETLLPQYDLVVFSDYNKGTLNNIESLIEQAKKAGKTVLVDPKQANLAAYSGADLITPNLSEFVLAGGLVESEEDIASSARQLLKSANIASMLLTRSEQGMSVINQTEKTDFPAKVREVSDVTGAGDTVIATMAVMKALGQSDSSAAEVANLAAGIVVAKLGAEVVSPEELAAAVNEQLLTHGTHYQCPAEQVFRHISLARKAGEKIVFTNGCFDILHAGHISYLEKAKSLGHRLVVGLNSDDSISRLKGPSRPINEFAHRATLLTALKSVDWVIPFGGEGNDTPLDLINTLQPDVLVKGGDYTLETIVGAKETLARGGEVKMIEFVNGCSTTKTIEKIQKIAIS
ncbi:bifunctional D-glycero-beta-D-manno-heptose-7-phosphate kinase/D-glycero-beta-D-manno-heptose 1-phosphate adenylyltransferase HldE [Marinagarivorans cellulosilyticus]|uniref:Bifunctional protein HldE n=1 Tax=Marinagarivorans cellulosilyticus TaxID=2721545 RepID=A0AAN1WJ18_9GAMM|nr:bifunctional D-glycero-beta-D-manno-heptose-7-phosphate kinase/D-glycero-beta-D-manno-heptose 1-phosphate adenylyltransferase HldE [Marinagarivorans cellulosilyticus]BCD98516.1 D-beta-D-heptose 7-phosphate kinase / D-beta-D-heptose 1-phosphate adenosyltransferase [Marinagarivorans cellulosilyticus]